MSSFSSIFTGSAMICSSPFGPTRFGPRRACMNPRSRRSTQFIAATITCTMMKATRNLTSGQTKYCIQGFIHCLPHVNAECKMQNAKTHSRELFCILHFAFCISSSVDLSQHDINGPNEGHEVGDEVTFRHRRQRLQIYE